MASFFSALFNRSEKKAEPETRSGLYPRDSFSLLQSERDGRAVVGTINKAYATYDRKNQFPWLLHIEVKLEPAYVQENGLPNDAENEVANDFEEYLMSEIKKRTTAHYIGHVFFDGYLDIYIYLPEPKVIHEYLQTQINKEGLIRGFGYEINEDPTWRGVEMFFDR